MKHMSKDNALYALENMRRAQASLEEKIPIMLAKYEDLKRRNLRTMTTNLAEYDALNNKDLQDIKAQVGNLQVEVTMWAAIVQAEMSMHRSL